MLDHRNPQWRQVVFVVNPVPNPVLKDLDRTSPEVFIAVKGYLYSEVNSHPVIQWFSKHYRPFADTEQGRFLLFIRRGGRLDSLFSAQGGHS